MKKFISLIFFLLAMNTNAQSDIDDGSWSRLIFTCIFNDPQYSSTPVKVIIDKGSDNAMFGILHAKHSLHKQPIMKFYTDKNGKVQVKVSKFKKERVYKLNGRGPDFIFNTSIYMKTGYFIHVVTDNTGSEQGKPGNCKRYN